MVDALRRYRQPGPLDVYFAGEPRAEVERVFFAGLQLWNRTFKTTAPGRLDDVNELVDQFLPRDRRLQVMDVAVSSGVTSAEWTEQLTRRGVEHDLIAGDLAVDGLLLTAGRRVAVLWERSGYPLALQLGSCTFYIQQEGRNRTSLVLYRPLRVLHRLASRLRLAAPGVAPARWAIRLRPVRLVTQRLLSDPTVSVIRDDITEPGRFLDQIDVCRAANILNRGYFSDSALQRIARNLVERLRPEGLLIVCRTPGDADCGGNLTTVFRLSDGALHVIARLNGGNEIEELILSSLGPNPRP